MISTAAKFLALVRAPVILVVLSTAAAAQDQAMRYTLSFADAQAHYVHVELEMTPSAGGELKLFLPVWTPGSYLVREFARHIDSVEAISKAGEALSVRKSSKNEWLVKVEATEPVRVRYRVYCNEMSVRTNFVDSEFGLLNGAATFLTSLDRRDERHVVTLQLRDSWRQSVSAMRRPVDGPPNSFVASSYDELVDSPILAGSPGIHPFQVGDVTHYLVNQGGDGLWDGEQAAADAAKVVAEHQRMWGHVPYDRYYFLNVIAESGGGLEHDNSTVLMTSRWSFRTPRSYKRWLGLVSHEFFHTWNVRRLRPAALQNYDYLGENYFDELWVAEGITSYYDDLALVRCGLTTPKEYLEALSSQIETLERTPGRLQQSLVESSHDTWIKFYRPNENSRNTSISYYTKGAVAAFLLDAEIRRLTKNEKSLDDVMRELYARFADEQGYTNADFLAIANEVAGSDLTAWFEHTILSARELDYQQALDWFGLKFKGIESGDAAAPQADDTTKAKPATNKSADRESAVDQQPSAESKQKKAAVKPWLGINVALDAGRLEIKRVTEQSPAFAAGLNVGDEVVGINGFRVTSGVDERLNQYRVGETVQVLVSRRGKLIELPVTVEAQPRQSWSLESIKAPTDDQRHNMAKWLGASQRTTSNK